MISFVGSSEDLDAEVQQNKEAFHMRMHSQSLFFGLENCGKLDIVCIVARSRGSCSSIVVW